jgi:HNH endonuclease
MCVTQWEQINDLLSYDPKTGLLTWKQSRGRVKAGAVAGSLRTDGYINVRVMGKNYLAQRLIWFIVTGLWPPDLVYHENTIKNDNRWDNLRLATRTQNAANRASKNEYRGVRPYGNRFQAYISINNAAKHLGYFDTPEEAHEAYCIAAVEQHGQFARFQ